MSNCPHVPAAFINAIREEGTKEEACDFLQDQWNEVVALRRPVGKAEAALAKSVKALEPFAKAADEADERSLGSGKARHGPID